MVLLYAAIASEGNSCSTCHHHDIRAMIRSLRFIAALLAYLGTTNAFTVHHTASYIQPAGLVTTTTALCEKKGGTAQFVGVQETTNSLDFVLSSITSDVGSIALGLVGLLIVLANRFADQDNLTADTLGQETRSDLLAVFACGAVLLNGVSKLDVTSALAESVVLDGINLDRPQTLISSTGSELRWAIDSVLAATPAKTAVLLKHAETWKTVVIAGVVPQDSALRTGTTLLSNPILDRFLQKTSKRTETYLPTLQALPGRVEFTYLPQNTQEALLLPVKDNCVLVLGSNTARSFNPRDVAWCQVLAKRIATFSLD
mmetsp:Transcript_20044/g.34243  ORF Transcript_20044/g.34243 Transcript_20044/m.34243 type:complete len:315 (-) Transcript_20044:1334-2278(-)